MRKTKQHGCLIPFLLCIALVVWIPAEFYRSGHHLDVTHIEMISPRLPQGFDGFKILHLSDMHEKKFGKNNEKLLQKARETAPDIIAVTGDLFQTEAGLTYARDTLAALRTIAPVLYVTGNHEWEVEWNDNTAPPLMDALRAICEETGCVFLDSKSYPLVRGDETLVFAGLCDPNGPADALSPLGLADRLAEKYSGAGNSATQEATRDADGSATQEKYRDPYTVVLSHRYELLDDYAAAGFDLVLAGHAHGGVVRLPFTDGLIGMGGQHFFPKHTSGVWSRPKGDFDAQAAHKPNAEGTNMVVSRGTGDTYFPRFLNPPELVVVTMRNI